MQGIAVIIKVEMTEDKAKIVMTDIILTKDQMIDMVVVVAMVIATTDMATDKMTDQDMTQETVDVSQRQNMDLMDIISIIINYYFLVCHTTHTASCHNLTFWHKKPELYSIQVFPIILHPVEVEFDRTLSSAASM